MDIDVQVKYQNLINEYSERITSIETDLEKKNNEIRELEIELGLIDDTKFAYQSHQFIEFLNTRKSELAAKLEQKRNEFVVYKKSISNELSALKAMQSIAERRIKS